MKAYKFEIICFDPNGDCDYGSMFYELKNQKYFCAQIISAQSTEIGVWEDDHPLNRHSTSEEFIRSADWVKEEL
jgi:hypothetical protein